MRMPIAVMFFFHSSSRSRSRPAVALPIVHDQRLAVGQVAPAVAVAVLVAEAVEQRLRASSGSYGDGTSKPSLCPATTGGIGCVARIACPWYQTRISSSVLKPITIARRSAILSGV